MKRPHRDPPPDEDTDDELKPAKPGDPHYFDAEAAAQAWEHRARDDFANAMRNLRRAARLRGREVCLWA